MVKPFRNPLRKEREYFLLEEEDLVIVFAIISICTAVISLIILVLANDFYVSSNKDATNSYNEALKAREEMIASHIHQENEHIALWKKFQDQKCESENECDLIALLLKDPRSAFEVKYLRILLERNPFGLSSTHTRNELREVLYGAPLPAFNPSPLPAEPDAPDLTIFDHARYWFWVYVIWQAAMIVSVLIFCSWDIFNPYNFTLTTFPAGLLVFPSLFSIWCAMWLFVFLQYMRWMYARVNEKRVLVRLEKNEEHARRKEKEKQLASLDPDLRMLYMKLHDKCATLRKEFATLPAGDHTKRYKDSFAHHMDELESQLKNVFYNQKTRNNAKDMARITAFGMEVVATIAELKAIIECTQHTTSEMQIDTQSEADALAPRAD